MIGLRATGPYGVALGPTWRRPDRMRRAVIDPPPRVIAECDSDRAGAGDAQPTFGPRDEVPQLAQLGRTTSRSRPGHPSGKPIVEGPTACGGARRLDRADDPARRHASPIPVSSL
jgi:hypothetical protein